MMAVATLWMLVNQGIGLRCWCPKCGRSWVLDARPMAAVMGPGFPIPGMRRWVVCTRPMCPRPDPDVAPDWPTPGVITRH